VQVAGNQLPLAGKLFFESNLKKKPRIDGNNDLRPRDRTTVTCSVAALHFTSQALGLVSAKVYSSYYPVEGHDMASYEAPQTMVSLICSIVNYTEVMNNRQLMAGFLEAGLEVDFALYETQEQLRELLSHEGVLRFVAKIGGEDVFQDQYLTDMKVQLILAGVILLTLGKHVNPQGYEGWFQNRVNTFGGVLGVATPQTIWTYANVPSQRNLVAGYHFLSTNFQLQREIFTLCSLRKG
jgi:hypothetical protein